MRTVQEIKDEIKTYEDEYSAIKKTLRGELHKTERRKLRKRIKTMGKQVKQLRDCLRYLESSPREEFILSLVSKLKKQREIIRNGYNDWAANNPDECRASENPELTYYKVMGTGKIEKQLQTLNYLLKT